MGFLQCKIAKNIYTAQLTVQWFQRSAQGFHSYLEGWDENCNFAVVLVLRPKSAVAGWSESAETRN